DLPVLQRLDAVGGGEGPELHLVRVVEDVAGDLAREVHIETGQLAGGGVAEAEQVGALVQSHDEPAAVADAGDEFLGWLVDGPQAGQAVAGLGVLVRGEAGRDLGGDRGAGRGRQDGVDLGDPDGVGHFRGGGGLVARTAVGAGPVAGAAGRQQEHPGQGRAGGRAPPASVGPARRGPAPTRDPGPHRYSLTRGATPTTTANAASVDRAMMRSGPFDDVRRALSIRVRRVSLASSIAPCIDSSNSSKAAPESPSSCPDEMAMAPW